MRFISILVERVSEVTIFVPSDRTTRSKGIINNANGRLENRVSNLNYHSAMVSLSLGYSRKTLNDHESKVGVGSHSAAYTFLVILGQTIQIGLSVGIPKIVVTPYRRFTHLIAPPTSCPRFRETIHRARYFPRAPEGASVMIAPASATYQQAVPMPLMAPLRIKY